MALDYPNSQFTAVDILDLLPEDFEEEAKELDESDTNCANNTLFTPMHPNLSTKLQNTTTPVIDSSTLDSSSYSNHILSQTDDDTTFDSSTFTAASVDVAAKIGHLFINGVAAPEVTPSLVVKRQLLKNLEFYQADVVDVGLPFPDNHFDFIKQHLVSSSFTVASWKKVMVELVRITKPGGYIQLLEIDYCTFNLGPKGRKWETQCKYIKYNLENNGSQMICIYIVLEATREKRHIEPRIACHLQDLLKAVGLVDVSSRLVSIPLGSWGQDLGVLWEQNVHNFSDSAAPVLSRLVGVSVSTYRRNWREMLEEVKDRKAFSNMHAAWGRKSPTGTIDWSLCPSLSQ
jgi:SAM-dependent methyltransferase